MRPLISVVMPAFNAASTIPFAVASLQAQSCSDWECVIIDDGSTDDSREAVHAIADPRIRYQRFDHNRGRGYARQYGLAITQGRYITFLDADDWIYPEKFCHQLELLEAEPDVSIVSTGMAISDVHDHLVGIRAPKLQAPVIRSPLRKLAMPPLAFAPAMIAADLAKETGFDLSFRTSEDVDFLLRILQGKPYAILQAPLYVYREHGSATLEKVCSALDYCCVMFHKYSAQHPLGSAIQVAKARTKRLLYRQAANFGFWEYMIQRRSRTPDAAAYQKYQDAWQVVSAIAAAQVIAI